MPCRESITNWVTDVAHIEIALVKPITGVSYVIGASRGDNRFKPTFSRK